MSTEILHKATKKALVPQLRFPEFEDDWIEKTLFDVSKDVSYGMNASATDFDGKNKYIRITDIDLSNRKFKPNPLTSPDGILEEKFKLKENDLLFTRTGASVGKSYLYDKSDGILYFAGFLIKFNIHKANSYFVSLLTLRDSYDKWVQINSMRSGQPGLNAEEYKNFKFNIPSLPEQQKIASFLSAVDEKTQQLTSKRELLEQYKKGVMQQLFSGELRFKDENGKDFPEWKERKLDSVLGQQIREVEKPKENYLAIGIRSHVKGTFQKPDSDPSKISMEKLFVVKENDLIVNITFAWEGAIAIAKKEDDGGLVSHRFPTYTFKSNLLSKDYFSQVILDKRFRLILDLISPGGAGRNRVLSKKEFLKIQWKFPCFEEQQKIANFLSSIDAKIESANQQLIQTQQFKKGLLQQLFV
jgi:type I restriction enzyme, S subunit